MKKLTLVLLILFTFVFSVVNVSAEEIEITDSAGEVYYLRSFITITAGYNINGFISKDNEKLYIEKNSITGQYSGNNKTSFGIFDGGGDGSLSFCIDEYTDYYVEFSAREPNGKTYVTIRWQDVQSEIIEERRISDIEVTETTKIYTGTDREKPTVLNIDYDGNGEVDYQLKCNEDEEVNSPKKIYPEDAEFDKTVLPEIREEEKTEDEKNVENRNMILICVIVGCAALVIGAVILIIHILKGRSKEEQKVN